MKRKGVGEIGQYMSERKHQHVKFKNLEIRKKVMIIKRAKSYVQLMAMMVNLQLLV